MRTHTFDDFDAFAEGVRGVESRMMPQNVKRRFWSHTTVDLDGVVVQAGRLGSGNIAEAQMDSGLCFLYLPLSDSVEYVANARPLEKDCLAIFEPGADVCIRTKDEHDWCGVIVPARLFDGGKSSGSLSGSTAGKVRVTPANRQAFSRLRYISLQIMTAAADCPSFESSPAAVSAADELMKVASLVIGPQQADVPDPPGRPKTSRQEIIDRSRALLETRDGEPVLVGDLAAAADVSERTLRSAFNEYYGTGPVRYLQLRQLHQVRRTLQAADPDEITVTDVLVRHGEWAFSRFAQRYRWLFDEYPSETLRGKSRSGSRGRQP
jgi:AraC family ethanolamine operon transcriptional activator